MTRENQPSITGTHNVTFDAYVPCVATGFRPVHWPVVRAYAHANAVAYNLSHVRRMSDIAKCRGNQDRHCGESIDTYVCHTQIRILLGHTCTTNRRLTYSSNILSYCRLCRCCDVQGSIRMLDSRLLQWHFQR